jgi:hypothetical protein
VHDLLATHHAAHEHQTHSSCPVGGLAVNSSSR